jgi:hypothetical protein
MKKLLSIIATTFIISSAMAQIAGWTLTSAGKTVTVTSETQVVSIDITKELVLNYKPAEPMPEMKRSIMLMDENDSELVRQEIKTDQGRFTIDAATLAVSFNNKKKLYLYTIALPSDPAKAALVRIRRMKICELMAAEKTSPVKTSAIKKKKKSIKKKGH